MREWILLIFLFSPFCFAEVTGLKIYQDNEGLQFLLPKMKELNSTLFITKYLELLNSHPKYHQMMDDQVKIGPGTEKDFLPIMDKKTVSVLVANRPGHMNRRDIILPTVLSELSNAGSIPIILPVGLELILSNRELKQFHDFIAQEIKFLIHLGGADIHPSLYGEELRGARDTYLKRDIVELNLVKTYIAHEKGMIVGFCRGHQLIGVAQGLKLIQDIPREPIFSSAISHSADSEMNNDHGRVSAYHEIQFSSETSLLREIFEGNNILVNSRHHQAVEYVENHPKVFISATEGDYKMVEALEFKNGRGYTFQFHPEDMKTEVSKVILQSLARRSLEILEYDFRPSNLDILKAPTFLCRGWRLAI